MQTYKIGKYKISLGMLFVLPCIIFFAFVVVYPACMVFYNAFFIKGAGLTVKPEWQGLSNFIKVVKTRNFGMIFGNTLMYALGCTALHMTLGMMFALLLNTPKLGTHFKHTFRTIVLVPWAITPTVVAIMAQLFFHPSIGPIQYIMRWLGSSTVIDPLGSKKWAMLTCILTNVWKFLPFYFLIQLTSMQAIDSTLYEAGRIDGGNKVQLFFRITIPVLKKSLLTLAMFDFVSNASYFDITWIMTQGGPMHSTETLAILIYKTAFQSTKFGLASAMGIFLFIMTVFISVLVLKSINKE